MEIPICIWTMFIMEMIIWKMLMKKMTDIIDFKKFCLKIDQLLINYKVSILINFLNFIITKN